MKDRLLRRPQGTHLIIALVNDQLLEGQHQQRAGHNDHGQCRGHIGVDGAFGHVLVVNQHRQHGIALAQQHGGAEVRQGGHEHHDAACQNGGQDHRQGDGPDPLELVHAQILRRLLQGAVDAVHGAGGIQIDVGEQVQGKDENDAVASVDGRRRQSDQAEKLGQKAVAAQQNDPGIGADEGGTHQRHDDEDVQQLLPRHIVPGHQIGDGYANDGGGDHGGNTHEQRPQQGLVIVGLGKEPDEVVQRDTLHLVGEHTLGDDGVEGIHDEQAHAQDHEQLREKPEVRPPFLGAFLLHNESTSSDSAS